LTLNLAQIRSAVSKIFHFKQTKKFTDSAKNRTLRSSHVVKVIVCVCMSVTVYVFQL